MLTQSFRQSDSGIKETEKNNEENNKNLRDELKKALEKRNLLEEKIQEEQIALTNSKKKNEDIIEKDKKNLMASNKIENDKFEAKENIDYISASEPKKKAVFLHVNDQADDLEKKITVIF